MAHGPVEYVNIRFPGSQITTDIIPPLKELITAGTVRIIDLMFIQKDKQGDVQTLEVSQLDPAVARVFEELEGEIDSLLSMDDTQTVAAQMPPDSSAALIVWEDLWAIRFAEAARAAHGEVADYERIPPVVVEAAFAAAEANPL